MKTEEFSALTYYDQVQELGSARPDLPRLNHNTPVFTFSDIKTDGFGNVIDQPLMRNKICFGRIEFRTRHGKYDTFLKLKSGKTIPKRSKCDACKHVSACTELGSGLIEPEEVGRCEGDG